MSDIWKIGILAVWITSIAYDSTRFVRREYTIRSLKIKKNCKVIVLSDLHNKRYGRDNEKLIRAIDEVNPDMIVVAGDMVTAQEKRTSYEVPIALLYRLAQKYPVYYGNGNHEYRMKIYKKGYGDIYQNYKKELKQCGVRMLENERVYLPDTNIELCGLEIEKYYYKRFKKIEMAKDYVQSLIGKAEESRFTFLIAHNPDYFKEYVGWGADLSVSGHLHGGVMRLPWLGGVISPMVKFFPRYDGGLFEEEDKRMIVSRGLGMHTIPLRIFNPAELVVVHLESEAE